VLRFKCKIPVPKG